MNYQVIQELESIQKRIIENFGRSDDPYKIARMIGDRIKELKARPADGEIITIPVVPPAGLLESMAMRYDHSWRAPSEFLSDEAILVARESEDFALALMAKQAFTTRERQSILGTMSQLHEEVVGKGFFRYD